MNIFVPFTRLYAETYAAVKDGQFVPLTGEHTYSKYFRDRCADGQTFINVEHDVVPTMEQLEELWNCPEAWCGFSYYYDKKERNQGYDPQPYLGCVKISADLIARTPAIWNEDICWSICDLHLLEKSPISYHYHGKDVKHLN